MSPRARAWLLDIAQTRVAELRLQHAAASRMFSPGHHQVGELARALTEAERALNELLAVPERVAA